MLLFVTKLKSDGFSSRYMLAISRFRSSARGFFADSVSVPMIFVNFPPPIIKLCDIRGVKSLRVRERDHYVFKFRTNWKSPFPNIIYCDLWLIWRIINKYLLLAQQMFWIIELTILGRNLIINHAELSNLSGNSYYSISGLRVGLAPLQPRSILHRSILYILWLHRSTNNIYCH